MNSIGKKDMARSQWVNQNRKLSKDIFKCRRHIIVIWRFRRSILNFWRNTKLNMTWNMCGIDLHFGGEYRSCRWHSKTSASNKTPNIAALHPGLIPVLPLAKGRSPEHPYYLKCISVGIVIGNWGGNRLLLFSKWDLLRFPNPCQRQGQ